MMSKPWETEPDSIDFEAEGLRCAMRRSRNSSWCGYVGIGPEHPLFGLPTNHPLKLPRAWFERRRGFEGAGMMDIFMFAIGGKELLEACPISLAFQVHGGVNWAQDSVPGQPPDGRWWFGFDCAHAGDYVPGVQDDLAQMVELMPPETREVMSRIINRESVYRDQQYVVSECQSLAAQASAIIAIITTTEEKQCRS